MDQLGEIAGLLIADLVDAGAEVFAEGTEADLAEIQPDPAYEDAMAVVIADELRRLYGVGREEAAAEREAQIGKRVDLAIEELDPTDEAAINEHLGVKSRSVAKRLLERFTAAFLLEASNQAAAGVFEAATLIDLLTGLSDRELRKDVRILTSEAMALGRQAEQEDDLDGATEAEYSARLDRNTCPTCRSLHGRTFEPGSPEYREAYPPLNRPSAAYVCDGRDKCRCLMLLRYETQAPRG